MESLVCQLLCTGDSSKLADIDELLLPAAVIQIFNERFEAFVRKIDRFLLELMGRRNPEESGLSQSRPASILSGSMLYCVDQFLSTVAKLLVVQQNAKVSSAAAMFEICRF